MSTRSNIIVQDEYKRIQVYRHYDGYPEGVIPELIKALEFAWPLPRFEADDFAAAIVRAWKDEGGGHIRIDGNPKAFEMVHGDTEYVYVIKFDKKRAEPYVEIYDWHDYWLEKVDINKKSFKPKVMQKIYFSQIKDYKPAQ
jgi:hypothetical protein